MERNAVCETVQQIEKSSWVTITPQLGSTLVHGTRAFGQIRGKCPWCPSKAEQCDVPRDRRFHESDALVDWHESFMPAKLPFSPKIVVSVFLSASFRSVLLP